jgi:type II secretory pathway component PulJ
MTRPAGGFTLIELLLALATTAILMLALSGTLSIAFKARDSSLVKAAETRGLYTALEMLRRDVESALPPNGILAGSFLGQPAAGSSHTLQLHRLRPSAGSLAGVALAGGARGGSAMAESGFTGLARVEIGLAPLADDTLPALVRQVTHNLLAPAVLPPASEVLCRRVRAFRCRFFDGTLWTDFWDSTTQGNVLPAAVEVELEVEAPSFRGAPPAVHRAHRTYTLPCSTPAAVTQASGGQASGGQTGGGL